MDSTIRIPAEYYEDFVKEIPQTLIAAGYTTEEAIQEAMIGKVLANGDYSVEKSILYDVEVQISYDGQITWKKAMPDDLPAGGLTITFLYPKDTDKDGYDFAVMHMFEADMNGFRPGDIEVPAVTKTTAGIQFAVQGMSPMSIAWKNASDNDDDDQEEDSILSMGGNVSTTPETGDVNNVGAWIICLVVSLGLLGTFAIVRRKKKVNK